MYLKKTVTSFGVISIIAMLLFAVCSQKKDSRQGDATPPSVGKAQDSLSNSESQAAANTAITATAPSDTISTTGKKQPTEKKTVVALSGLDTVTAIVEGTPGQLLVFDLYADWCRPCKMLAPMYDSLASTHGHRANFYRVDVQRNPDIAAAFGVRGIPLVVFMKDQKVVQALTGLNPRKSYERILTSCGPMVSLEECRKNLSKPL